MDKDFSALCTFFYLQNELKKLEEYDGYTTADLEEYYERDNGFNLKTKFQESINYIYDQFSFYISEYSLELIKSNKKCFDFNCIQSELSKVQEELFSYNLEHQTLIMNALTDLYFYNKRVK